MEEWSKFEFGIRFERAEKVRVVVNVGRKWKGSDWWDESLRVPIKEKKWLMEEGYRMDQREL